jgi:hypothetical protein
MVLTIRPAGEHAPVVKRISHRSPEPVVQVRLLAGAVSLTCVRALLDFPFAFGYGLHLTRVGSWRNFVATGIRRRGWSFRSARSVARG